MEIKNDYSLNKSKFCFFKISTQVHIDTNKKPHEQVSITSHDTCEENTSALTYTTWNSENKTLFNQFFDSERFNSTLHLLEDINHKGNIQQKDVNDITKNISNILTQAADYAGMLRQRNPHNKQSTRRREETHKPWYSAECETKRHKYIRFKNKYRTLKNTLTIKACKQRIQKGN